MVAFLHCLVGFVIATREILLPHGIFKVPTQRLPHKKLRFRRKVSKKQNSNKRILPDMHNTKHAVNQNTQFTKHVITHVGKNTDG